MKKSDNCPRMNRKLKNKKNKNRNKQGYGLIDYIVNKLPEIHIPGYQYCGPGTDLEKRLSRGDPGINKLDQACKAHDIAYSKTNNSTDRRVADKALVSHALPRIYSQDAKLGERAAALLVSGLMGAKIGLSKIGLGLKKKKKKMPKKKRSARSTKRRTKKSQRRRTKSKKSRSKKKQKLFSFGKLVRGVRETIKKSKLKSSPLNDTIQAAIRTAKSLKRNKKVNAPRVLKVPKFGGNVLSMVPIISALSAVGAISPSSVAVMKAIKEIQNFKPGLNEQSNKKIGRNLHLITPASGSGFYLRPFHNGTATITN